MKLPRIELYCDTCGSTHIGSDACAHWDVLKQAWVFTDVYDNTWCTDCGSECIEERELHGFADDPDEAKTAA